MNAQEIPMTKASVIALAITLTVVGLAIALPIAYLVTGISLEWYRFGVENTPTFFQWVSFGLIK